MKYNELQEGKLYKIDDSKSLIFKILNGKLLSNSSNGFTDSWTESGLTFNFIATSEFEEYKEPLDTSRLEFNMLVFVKDLQSEDWKIAHFIEYVEDSALPFRVFDFGASAITAPARRAENVNAYMECKIPTGKEITEIFEANKKRFLGTKLATVKQESGYDKAF